MVRTSVSSQVAVVTALAFFVLGACASDDKGKSSPSVKQPTQPATTTTPPPKATPPAPTPKVVAKQPVKADPPVSKEPPPVAKKEPVPPKALAGQDFVADAKTLYKATMCRGSAALPSKLNEGYWKKHCAFVNKRIAKYKRRWLSKARPFFDKLVPNDVGTKVVYPFGGGDLMTALAVFPKLTEVTTLSLEPSGDPRSINTISQRMFKKYWSTGHHHVASLLVASHSRTVDMIEAFNYGKLPGEVIFSLMALAIHDMEVVSLRYFSVEPDGTLKYLSAADLAAADKAVADAKGGRNRRRARKARKALFKNMELRFRKPGGALKMHRHIRANLGNKHLKKDGRVIAHLEAKGKVPAMTKAASYLLWHGAFSIIRNYLIKNVDWMVSDATGIPPRIAKKAGYEQITYGRFNSHISTMGNPGQRQINDFKRLWKNNKYRPLKFMFGYSGGKTRGWLHLMVTRRKK